MSWLDAIPSPVRVPLVGGSIAVLGAATVGLGAVPALAGVEDAIATTVVLGVAAAYGAAWWRWGRPHRQALQSARERATSAQQGRAGQAVGSFGPNGAHTRSEVVDALAVDPRFSLPVWTAAVRALCGPGPSASPRLLEAVRTDNGVRCRVAVREPARLRHLTVLTGTGGPTVLDDTMVPDAPDPAPTVDPGWMAARRALVARDGTFDVIGFEAQARGISFALDAGPEAAGAYVTSEGALDLAYWRVVGLPPGGEDVRWLEIEQDAVFDRVEIRVGGRVLSLCRPAARREAPWELWRLQRAAPDAPAASA